MNIAIIGAGISGMSVAYALKDDGHVITIFAENFSPNITSNKAAAFWFPYHVRNDARGIGWCQTSYQYFKMMSAQTTETGVRMQQLAKEVPVNVAEDASWLSFMPEGSYRIVPENELAPGIANRYEVSVPLIETQIFLPWLQAQLSEAGITFRQQKIIQFSEILAGYDWIINCAALGNLHELCKDEALIPVRGQVALLTPASRFPIHLNNEKQLYVVPRKDAIIVGGTYEMGVNSAETEPGTIQKILEKAYIDLPFLKTLTVSGAWAGVRPYRETVCVEKDAELPIIHNYGHGGSGFTLSFGCAFEVRALINSQIG